MVAIAAQPLSAENRHCFQHRMAALAAWPVLHALRQNPRARNGAPVPAHQ